MLNSIGWLLGFDTYDFSHIEPKQVTIAYGLLNLNFLYHKEGDNFNTNNKLIGQFR